MHNPDILEQIKARLSELSKQPPDDAGSTQNTQTVAGNRKDARPIPQPIAIIGLSGYLPKSRSVQDFWRALDNDEDLLEEIPKSRFDWQKHYDPSAADAMKSHTKWGGFIPDIRGFDARFFQMLPNDAKRLDPRQRLLLMSVYHTLEDAGYAPESLRKTRTGMFVGAEENEYVKLSQWDKAQSEGIGNAPSMIANQISYFFDWRGPSEYMNTMCSGGAVAIHRAVASLRSGECSQAVAGVANLLLRPETFISLSAMGQMSTRCSINSFGRDADGYLPAEGVASILLKPLAQAEADGDAIYAVLKHTAVNFNGQGGMSIASPNISSHTELILQCYREAGIDPRNLEYIEAQGMANPVTDIAEWSAFNRALQTLAQQQNVSLKHGNCTVSTLKPTLGHMQSASAFGALFKIIRSFDTDTIHKIRDFRHSSPDIDSKHQPCRLATENRPWPRQAQLRLAGLHAYGSGGNNAHLLLEEYRPEQVQGAVQDKLQVLPFSAKTQQQCRTLIAEFLSEVREHPEYAQASIAHTLQTGRDAMNVRVAFVSASRDQWIQQAEAYLGGRLQNNVFEGLADSSTVSVCTATDPYTRAQNWARGQKVDWPSHNVDKQARLHLPTYPFELRDYWLDDARTVATKPDADSLENAACRNKKSPQQITSFNKDTMMNASPEIIQGEGSAGEKAAELFTYCAETSDQDFHEDYLTFCPFPERIPGFSMTRVFLNPKDYRAEMALIQRKQIEMRQVLFFKEDFTQMRSLLDIGCGHGTDVIQIANHYPHIHTDGFTITKAQAELGNHRISQKGLNAQARIFNHDSSKVKFPRNDYDVIIGFEVSCLVADKDGLFSNIESSLKNHGRVLLMDFIANLHGAIEDPSIDIYIPTQEQWVKTLAKHHLVIDEIIDVSPQIANFQYDPEHENNVKDCPKVVRDSWRNYANNAIAIDRGWLSYMLFRLRKDLYANVAELEQYNLAKLRAPKPYPVALQEMLELSHVPYPILDETLLADAYPDERKSPVNRGAASRFALLKTKLAGLFDVTLSLPPGELEQAETFQDLGISSINSVELLQAINGEFGLTLPTSLIFAHNTLDSLTRYLETYLSEHQPQQLEKLNNALPVTQAENVVANPLAEKLLALFVNSLNLAGENLSSSDKFNELGLTSINAVELMQAINAEFQLTLPTSVMFECNSLDALADYLTALGVSVAGDAQKKSLN